MVPKAMILTFTLMSLTMDPNAAGPATLSPGVGSMTRFLKQDAAIRSPRAAQLCHKDGKGCSTNAKCCNNKCVDLRYDNGNCGMCKWKCKFSHVCCDGLCVNVSFDTRHCGSCGNKCKKGRFCVYGMCDYA